MKLPNLISLALAVTLILSAQNFTEEAATEDAVADNQATTISMLIVIHNESMGSY